MSAILSADDLNDFIVPGVACIKPVETLPPQKPTGNEWEVTTEDKVAAEQPPPAQISLTDCLACSGCVTSAEAVLVSLQSYAEVLSSLDSAPSISLPYLHDAPGASTRNGSTLAASDDATAGKLFVATISPQVRASIAATYGTSEREAGYMIEQLLCGRNGIGLGGKFGNRFAMAIDNNAMREVCLVMEAERVKLSMEKDSALSRPVLTSACPGWICYAEKTHPHVLPHLSPLKSPQALSGTLLKSVLSRKSGIRPSDIWHLAVMPCFDKKLEAARQELTDVHWRSPQDGLEISEPVRDVDCVITARELLMLADSRGISFPSLPRHAVSSSEKASMPDPLIERFLSRRRRNNHAAKKGDIQGGTSGGYLYHVLCTQKATYPGSEIRSERGRNPDIVDYSVVLEDQVKFRGARYYGFRNIQNLVRKLRPAKKSRMPGAVKVTRKPGTSLVGDIESAYIEVMACPGGCTNGGGQIKVDDLGELQQQAIPRIPSDPKEWLASVDEAYYSMEDESAADEEEDQMDLDTNNTPDLLINGISPAEVHAFVQHWASVTGIDSDRLLYTTFRAVESDVGKKANGSSSTEHVVELASKIGGGW